MDNLKVNPIIFTLACVLIFLFVYIIVQNREDMVGRTVFDSRPYKGNRSTGNNLSNKNNGMSKTTIIVMVVVFLVCCMSTGGGYFYAQTH